MKETVKDMLVVSTTDPIEKMHLINSLCRLRVSYHFENEIEEQLNHLFITLPKLLNDYDYDLHIVALVFQVFRFNGYKLPCGEYNIKCMGIDAQVIAKYAIWLCRFEI